MPTFSNSFPTAADGFPFDLKRTPPTGTLSAIVTSPEIWSTRTHFANNRTVPCESPKACKLCEDGFAWRTHLYLTAFDPKTSEHFIFECTPKAAETLKNYLIYNPELRGCLIKASRPTGRPNGRVLLTARKLDVPHLRLPHPPNVPRLLCHIWGVQYAETDQPLRLAQLFKDATKEREKGDGQTEEAATN